MAEELSSHEFHYPQVAEIPLNRLYGEGDDFGLSSGEVDDTGYPPNVARFAKKLAETPVRKTVDYPAAAYYRRPPCL